MKLRMPHLVFCVYFTNQLFVKAYEYFQIGIAFHKCIDKSILVHCDVTGIESTCKNASLHCVKNDVDDFGA